MSRSAKQSQTVLEIARVRSHGAHYTRRSVVIGGGIAAVSSLAIRSHALASSTRMPGESTPAAGSNGKVVIYSGRNENLIGPLVDRFQQTTGIDAEVRYGDTAELAATILDEGDNSPADLFFSQDAGALGALAAEDRLQALPEELLARVGARFHSNEGLWVGTSGRARVAVYNTDQLQPENLPASILGLTDTIWRGKLGWAPTNGSFQAFITAFRVLQGEDAVREWLQGMLANDPVVFDGNGPLTLAVGEGELAVGLVNHYYMYEIQAEEGKTFPLANHFFSAGDPGSLINVAGAGILTTAKNQSQALAFAEFLLQSEAQEYFATKTFEYPLIAGVKPSPGLIALADIESPDIDLGQLSDLEGTLELLIDTGVI